MITRHLFWSGGWDSTFRLLYVLLLRGEAIQPYYIKRSERQSTHRELSTQAAVRDGLAAQYPDTAARLLPTKMIENHDLAIVPKRLAQVQRLRRADLRYAKLLYDDQYVEMAYVAEHVAAGQPHPPFEMGIIKDGIVHQRFYDHLDIAEIDGEVQFVFETQLKNPDLEFFRRFSFPLLFYTKVEMGELAKTYGFADLLSKSWFCHRPIWGGIPCGTCFPCRDAREMGMGYRLHPISHVRYYLAEYVKRPLLALLPP